MNFPNVAFVAEKKDFSNGENVGQIEHLFEPVFCVFNMSVHQNMTIDPETQNIYVFTALCPVYKNTEPSHLFNNFLEAFVSSLGEEDFKYLQFAINKRKTEEARLAR